MRKIQWFTLVCFTCFALVQTHAQRIVEDDFGMSLGVQNGLVVEMEGADRKLSEKLWKNYIKDYGKVKKNKKAKEWYTEEAVRIPSISTSSDVVMYTKFDENRNMTRAYFWVDLGGAFMNSIDHEAETEGAELFITAYYNEVKKEVIKRELEDQEKALRDLQKQLSKLEKENTKYHREIEEAQDKIRKREADIEKNAIDQEAKRSEIEAQAKVVDEIVNRLNSVGKS